jgi:hypothetical protein
MDKEFDYNLICRYLNHATLKFWTDYVKISSYFHWTHLKDITHVPYNFGIKVGNVQIVFSKCKQLPCMWFIIVRN